LFQIFYYFFLFLSFLSFFRFLWSGREVSGQELRVRVGNGEGVRIGVNRRTERITDSDRNTARRTRRRTRRRESTREMPIRPLWRWWWEGRSSRSILCGLSGGLRNGFPNGLQVLVLLVRVLVGNGNLADFERLRGPVGGLGDDLRADLVAVRVTDSVTVLNGLEAIGVSATSGIGEGFARARRVLVIDPGQVLGTRARVGRLETLYRHRNHIVVDDHHTGLEWGDRGRCGHGFRLAYTQSDRMLDDNTLGLGIHDLVRIWHIYSTILTQNLS